ncbi:hypothetical protein ACP6L2_09520 [Sphingobacterium lactis]|uniref:hypothetical protein n=1 Tax=Sphingobacterium lactis TaxID=797291 RepID=UPI003F7E3B2B
MKNVFFFVFFSIISVLPIQAQTGLTAGPPRVYFISDPGQQQIKFIDISNPSTDYALELGVSFEDWSYSETGDNVLSPKGSLANSCANWLSVSEPYFSLAPGESKRLQVIMNVPKDLNLESDNSVHTSMLFITQLNPKASADKAGATIRLAVRSGIKIYHRLNSRPQQDVEITNISYLMTDSIGGFLVVDYKVMANTWLEGKVRSELLNQDNGKKINLSDILFYALPNDIRRQYIPLPPNLSTGKYMASVIFLYNDQESIKMGELEFDYVAEK